MDGFDRQDHDNHDELTHPYLTGNFAPVTTTNSLTPCSYTGTIPNSLANGQYVRNGANPLINEDVGRDAHWFDGDGMLTGVLFKKLDNGQIQPNFVNQWIETDVWKAAQHWSLVDSFWRITKPIPPSIATLVNPAGNLFLIIWAMIRTVFLVLISHLPWSSVKIKRISVANTAIHYHDGRALATCESGPPMTIGLPELSTHGWFEGREDLNQPAFGGEGIASVLKEYTTGHPKVDPNTGEMILFHNTFIAPYTQYSVVTSKRIRSEKSTPLQDMLNIRIPGITSPKLMHDFGVSAKSTIILDLPLSLDPTNLLKGKAVVNYDPTKPSRFGVFPRHCPDLIKWYEDDPCIIFHTASTWDEYDSNGKPIAVSMLACRMTNPSVIFNAGNLDMPYQNYDSKWIHPEDESQTYTQITKDLVEKSSNNINTTNAFDVSTNLEKAVLHEQQDYLIPPEQVDQCRLHYFRFPISEGQNVSLRPSHSFALSSLPVEFPTCTPSKIMAEPQFIYTCSTSVDNFSAALCKAAKIDVIVKMNTAKLIQQGKQRNMTRTNVCVDERSGAELMANSKNDSIQLFKFPPGIYGGEARFVASGKDSAEDSGHLLFFAFDEVQLSSDGQAPPSAISELWILNAKTMKDVVAKVTLTQRVPYGLHGDWFDERMIREQRINEAKKQIEAAY